MEDSAPTSILDLPDHCLLAALQHLASQRDYCSLMCASSANSMLHQAVSMALREITAVGWQQQRVDGCLLYCKKHSIRSIALSAGGVVLKLPDGFHPSSISLHVMRVQISPRDGIAGMQGAAATLTQLYLESCVLRNGAAGLLPALAQLPALQRLTLMRPKDPDPSLQDLASLTGFELAGAFPAELAQLSHLDVEKVSFRKPAALLHLTGLKSLSLMDVEGLHFRPEALPPALQLTGLCLSLSVTPPMFSFGGHQVVPPLDPAALAQQTALQHLEVSSFEPRFPDVAALLSAIGQLQQLTQLRLFGFKADAPSLAAYSALTASSKLQVLELTQGWSVHQWTPFLEHIIPAGKQLPQLRVLRWCPKDARPEAADVRTVVRGCPGLTQLALYEPHEGSVFWRRGYQPAAVLRPLLELTGLQQLQIAGVDEAGVRVLAGLSSLRELELHCGGAGDAAVQAREQRSYRWGTDSDTDTDTDTDKAEIDTELQPHYTQLTQLTFLKWHGAMNNVSYIYCPKPNWPPVWQQIADDLEAKEVRSGWRAGDSYSEWQQHRQFKRDAYAAAAQRSDSRAARKAPGFELRDHPWKAYT